MATSATFQFSSAAGSQAITWTWAENRAVGQYCTGDWWVVGPITLQSITRPQGDPDRDGSQYGPESLATWGVQAMDDRADNLTYDESLNIANDLPLSVAINKSIISAISRTESFGNNQLSHQAILTVVETAPAAGSFRPFYGGTGPKVPLHNKSDIDYSRMLTLDPVTSASSLADIAEGFRYPIITLGNNYPGIEYYVARYNSPIDGSAYGAQMASATTAALTTLNSDFSDAAKEEAAIGFIQMGIDTYGVISAGGVFPSAGGHNYGHKAPMVFAAWVLDDTDMQDACELSGNGTNDDGAAFFAEDQSTFYVEQYHIDDPRVSPGYYSEAYPQESLGMAEWGPGEYPHAEAGYNWDRAYRHNVFLYLTETALVFRLMGLEWLWNHPAFFEYSISRYAVIENPSAPSPPRVGGIAAHTTAMFSAYGSIGLFTPTHSIAGASLASSYVLDSSRLVTLTGNGDIEQIRYTTNGDVPSGASTLYSAPFVISEDCMVKWRGFATGRDPSAVGVFEVSFITDGTPAPPTSLTVTY